jgi:hypothetical protein
MAAADGSAPEGIRTSHESAGLPLFPSSARFRLLWLEGAGTAHAGV